ncbi:MAG: hypothetical protein H6705_05010 [Myxococcales bacterium]|nr:hypothetical protein [Myxococcales bacterium]
MSDDRPVEPIARDLLADGSAALTLRLDAFAGGLAHRLEGFGVARRSEDSPLLQAITARWTLPDRLDGGIELFDLDAFDAWAADWSIRAGYDDVVGDAESAGFVIPIDPDLRPAGIDARSARREGRAERAFRPVVAPRRAETRAAARAEARAPARAEARAPAAADAFAPARVEAPDARRAPRRRCAASRASEFRKTLQGRSPTPRSSPRPRARVETAERAATARAPIGPSARAGAARERWRAVDGERLSAYPAAMGRAGALDASLLRFPEARARIGGERPAVIAAPAGFDLTPDTAGLAPAARGAERRVQALVDRLVPAAPSAVAGWLVPVAAADADGRPLPAASARPGRWQSIGSAPRSPCRPRPRSTRPRSGSAPASPPRPTRSSPASTARWRPQVRRLTYELEPAGVLVEPGAERSPVEARVESRPRRRAGEAPDRRRGPAQPRRWSRRPARRRRARRPGSAPSRRRPQTRRRGAPRTPRDPDDGCSRRHAERSAAALDRGRHDACRRNSDRGARCPCDRRGRRLRRPRSAPERRPRATTRGGLARGIAERFAASGEGSEPRLAARARAAARRAPRSADPPADARRGDRRRSRRRAPRPDRRRRAPAAGGSRVHGRPQRRRLPARRGRASIGRFADRLAVGVGGEPGAAAAWLVAPTGELVAIGPDGAPVEQRGARAAAERGGHGPRGAADGRERARVGRRPRHRRAGHSARRARRGRGLRRSDRRERRHPRSRPRRRGRAPRIARRARRGPRGRRRHARDFVRARPAAARTSVIDALQAALAAGPAAAGEVGAPRRRSPVGSAPASKRSSAAARPRAR